MRTHVRTDSTSFANSILLLAMVAGVLSLDLFEGEAVSGYNGHRTLCPTELVLDAEFPLPCYDLYVSHDVPDVDVVEKGVPSQFYVACLCCAISVAQNTGQITTGPFYSSSSRTTPFNIPHQNSDEDEPFILSADVA